MEGDTTSVVGENEVNLGRGIDEMELQVRRMSTFGMGMEVRISDHARPEELEKRQQICALVLLCYIAHSSHLMRTMSKYTSSAISDENSENERRSVQLMAKLVQTEKCRHIIRMSPQAFLKLCEKLRSSAGMKDSTRVTVEGLVAEFLYIVGQDAKSRTKPFLFHLSGETFNRRFHYVLKAIMSLLHSEFLPRPSGVDVPSQILNDSKFYPYFKDCIGVIGIAHSRVQVPVKDVPRYCGTRRYPTQIIFATCDFDMKFTYVLVGWEGSASYPRVLVNAFTREDPLRVPEGKYFIARAGFTPKPGVLTPYRGISYCLKQYSTQGPQNYQELFNFRHSLLQNVIERAFGVLKKRFPITTGENESYFSVQTMSSIIRVCCVLHNFLMGIDIDEQIIAEVDRELLRDKSRSVSLKRKREVDSEEKPSLSKTIALEMWNANEV